MALESTQFADFFYALWGTAPFPWQERLAKKVCKGEWPGVVDLPTASGKTACLEIAVFALALQGNTPDRTVGRRIFFAVNRRVIADEAHARAVAIAKKLADPGKPILRTVANALRRLSGETKDESRAAPPLDVAHMRGGIMRDDRWARSIAQPTIITSTIDQVGSRLLFRGYGVSEFSRSVHAALVAHDSTILLDEAHISRPFAALLESVRRYRGADWAKQPIVTPFQVVQLTATPADRQADVFCLDDRDRRHPVLRKRHNCAKPCRLEIAEKARGGKASVELARLVVATAINLCSGDRRNIGIIVNRVATARHVARLLDEARKAGKHEAIKEADVYLAIGSMRPLDRDDLTKQIESRVGKERAESLSPPPMFVVATQCLEVGADYDFDGMVLECASLDALRQRAGRLNRAGREIDARGSIVIRADQTKLDEDDGDPVYGSALSKAWNWLKSVAKAGDLDFGVSAMGDAVAQVAETKYKGLLAPETPFPSVFPHCLDAWAQTSPRPSSEEKIETFLHGKNRGEPDVNVCWRDDLRDMGSADWAQIVSLCPPTSPECMPVPIGVFRNWLAGVQVGEELSSDVLDAAESDAPDPQQATDRVALRWRGADRSDLVSRPDDVQPGDTFVLRSPEEGRPTLGCFPDWVKMDRAEEAYRKTRGRALIRFYRSRWATWPDVEPVRQFVAWCKDPDSDLRIADVRDLLGKMAEVLQSHDAELAELAGEVGRKGDRFDILRCGGNEVVLRSRKRISDPLLLPVMDDGEDEMSRTQERERVALEDHTEHVRDEVKTLISCLAFNDFREELLLAAELHDLGKADERFQAVLINGDVQDATAQQTLFAKSARKATSAAERALARVRAGLPKGFRHEMLSVLLAGKSPKLPPDGTLERDLVLHLIAAHHGRARPFTDHVSDEHPPRVSLEQLGLLIELSSDERKGNELHRFDSPIGSRFWLLTRQFGWWGLAYLEAVLRLADQRASQREDAASEPSVTSRQPRRRVTA